MHKLAVVAGVEPTFSTIGHLRESVAKHDNKLEPRTGFEPVPSAWKAVMLPLTPTRLKTLKYKYEISGILTHHRHYPNSTYYTLISAVLYVQYQAHHAKVLELRVFTCFRYILREEESSLILIFKSACLC